MTVSLPHAVFQTVAIAPVVGRNHKPGGTHKLLLLTRIQGISGQYRGCRCSINTPQYKCNFKCDTINYHWSNYEEWTLIPSVIRNVLFDTLSPPNPGMKRWRTSLEGLCLCSSGMCSEVSRVETLPFRAAHRGKAGNFYRQVF